jgi:hypothetical protein
MKPPCWWAVVPEPAKLETGSRQLKPRRVTGSVPIAVGETGTWADGGGEAVEFDLEAADVDGRLPDVVPQPATRTAASTTAVVRL